VGSHRQSSAARAIGTFADRTSLVRRWYELLGRRERHGYVSTPTPRPVAGERTEPRVAAQDGSAHATERAILEDHGLRVEDATARALVDRWHAATSALVDYVRVRGLAVLDLVDASTLADMFVSASFGVG
jgi:hypothetical protein